MEQKRAHQLLAPNRPVRRWSFSFGGVAGAILRWNNRSLQGSLPVELDAGSLPGGHAMRGTGSKKGPQASAQRAQRAVPRARGHPFG